MSSEALFHVISIVNFSDYLYECSNINFHEHISFDAVNVGESGKTKEMENFNPYNDGSAFFVKHLFHRKLDQLGVGHESLTATQCSNEHLIFFLRFSYEDI